MSESVVDKSLPPVDHYVIPGTDLQLIDIIRAKMTPNEWRRFLWASALQYCYRALDKAEPVKDCNKGVTYLTWLRDSHEVDNRGKRD